MVPKGRHTIKACMGTACYVRGIAEVMSRLQAGYQLDVGGTTEDRRFSLEAVRCLGACGLAPVVVVDEDTHGGVTPDRILDILERYE
jgi:NADH:ubiquinone oxidoreductase subunit E